MARLGQSPTSRASSAKKISRNIGDSLRGSPRPSEGSPGDIQLRIDDAPKMFCRIADTWYENVLFPAGEGIRSTNKGLVIRNKSKDIISFGQAGIQVDTQITGADVPLRINNDGAGYSQIIMGGANPEIKLGFAGSGASVTSSIAGTSKISFNLAGADNIGFTDYARAGTIKFAMGHTYESSTDEFRLVYDGDPRVEAKAGIRMDTSGNIGFHGLAPASRPDYTISNLSTDRALDCNSTSTAELADVLGQLITDLIAIGLLQ